MAYRRTIGGHRSPKLTSSNLFQQCRSTYFYSAQTPFSARATSMMRTSLQAPIAGPTTQCVASEPTNAVNRRAIG